MHLIKGWEGSMLLRQNSKVAIEWYEVAANTLKLKITLKV
jgi:hypothetical protein